MRSLQLICAAVAEYVASGHNAAVEGTGERHRPQHCAGEHGCGGEEAGGAERGNGSRGGGGGRGVWVVFSRRAALSSQIGTKSVSRRRRSRCAFSRWSREEIYGSLRHKVTGTYILVKFHARYTCFKHTMATVPNEIGFTPLNVHTQTQPHWLNRDTIGA